MRTGPARRDPQGGRGRSLPADLDRAVGGSAIAMRLQGHRPERPLTHDLFATALSELGVRVERVVIADARRRDVPRAARAGRARRPPRGRRAAVRRARAGGARRVPDLRRRDGPRPGGGAAGPDDDEDDDDETTGEEGEGEPRSRPARAASLEATGEALDPTKLDIFRDFVNSLDRTTPRRREHGRQRRAAAPRADRPGVSRPGSACRAGRARRAFAHSRRRSAQKSLTARQITLRLRARRGAGGPRVVRDADLGDRRPARRELDQQLGREERAARLDPDALERVAPEELAGAVDVADPQAEEDPVGEPVGAGVDDPDRAGRRA